MYDSKRFSREKQRTSVRYGTSSVTETAIDDTQYAEIPGKPFDLLNCIRFLLSKAGLILLFALLCTLLALVFFQLVPPQYKATAKLYILGDAGMGGQLSSLQAGSLLLADYSEIFKTWEVHEAVRAELALDLTWQEMQRMLSIQTPSGSRLLYITVTHSDAAFAARLANAYASAAHSFIADKLHNIQPELFSSAIVPSHISGLGLPMLLLLAFATGILLTTGFYIICFCLDDRIRSADDLARAAGVKVLASIPRQDQNTVSKEQIYLLASRLMAGKARCLLFSAPHGAQGVSFVCAELLHAFGKMNQRALWLCVEYTESPAQKTLPTIEDYLQERCSWQQLLQTHQNIALLLIQGTGTRLPSWLHHPRMEALMQELRNAFDYILIDVPPMDQQAIGSAFCAYCDSCILVCRQNGSSYRKVSDYYGFLSESGMPLLGSIFNEKSFEAPKKPKTKVSSAA